MLGKRTFAEALALLLVFWFFGEIFLGFNRTTMADTFTGDVYFVTMRNGKKVMESTGAKVRVDLVESGYIYDKVRGMSGSGLRINFSGNTSVLKRFGIDQGLMQEDGSGGICEVKTSDSRINGSFFDSGANPHTSYLAYYNYAMAHHMTFFEGDIDCKTIHVGIVSSHFIHVAFDGLNAKGFVFASLSRDSHLPFIQRIIMMFRSDPDGVKAMFLAKS